MLLFKKKFVFILKQYKITMNQKNKNFFPKIENTTKKSFFYNPSNILYGNPSKGFKYNNSYKKVSQFKKKFVKYTYNQRRGHYYKKGFFYKKKKNLFWKRKSIRRWKKQIFLVKYWNLSLFSTINKFNRLKFFKHLGKKNKKSKKKLSFAFKKYNKILKKLKNKNLNKKNKIKKNKKKKLYKKFAKIKTNIKKEFKKKKNKKELFIKKMYFIKKKAFFKLKGKVLKYYNNKLINSNFEKKAIFNVKFLNFQFKRIFLSKISLNSESYETSASFIVKWKQVLNYINILFNISYKFRKKLIIFSSKIEQDKKRSSFFSKKQFFIQNNLKFKLLKLRNIFIKKKTNFKLTRKWNLFNNNWNSIFLLNLINFDFIYISSIYKAIGCSSIFSFVKNTKNSYFNILNLIIVNMNLKQFIRLLQELKYLKKFAINIITLEYTLIEWIQEYVDQYLKVDVKYEIKVLEYVPFLEWIHKNKYKNISFLFFFGNDWTKKKTILNIYRLLNLGVYLISSMSLTFKLNVYRILNEASDLKKIFFVLIIISKILKVDIVKKIN